MKSATWRECFCAHAGTALSEKLIGKDTDEFQAKMLFLRRQLENEVGQALLSTGSTASRETLLGEGAERGLERP